MPTVDIPFGEWLPSAPDFKNPGCLVADNVIPSTGGYKPFLSAFALGDSINGAAKGATQFFKNDGTRIIVGGTDSRLFTYTGGTVTETSGYTDPGTGEAWDFARFNDFVIATANNNAPQYLTDIDSDTGWSALTGSPPNAKRCARVGEFLMLGSTTDGPNYIQWSSYNAPGSSWAASRTTQAGTQPLPAEFGEVQRIVGGRYALIFQKTAITRLTYVGPPTVWRADIISRDRGTPAPFSVVSLGYLTYFLGQDGFFVTDGASVQPIGTQRVNKWFFENVAQDNIPTVQGAVDVQNQCIVWKFASITASTPDRLLMYSYEHNRWSTATVSTSWILGAQVDATTLEQLDAIYGNLDSIPVSLDSTRFRENAGALAAFIDSGSTSEYHTFRGGAAEATWETGEFQPSPNQRVFVDEVTPMMEANTWDANASLIVRDNRGAETTLSEATAGWSGFCPVRGEGMKMRIKLVKPANDPWDAAQGVQVKFRGAGQR